MSGIKAAKSKAVNITLLENQDIPLWVVHSHIAHPEVHCLKVLAQNGGLYVWGYSVWKGTPGFRTLGITISQFEAGEKAYYFTTKNDALAYLSIILEPKL